MERILLLLLMILICLHRRNMVPYLLFKYSGVLLIRREFGIVKRGFGNIFKIQQLFVLVVRLEEAEISLLLGLLDILMLCAYHNLLIHL